MRRVVGHLTIAPITTAGYHHISGSRFSQLRQLLGMKGQIFHGYYLTIIVRITLKISLRQPKRNKAATKK